MRKKTIKMEKNTCALRVFGCRRSVGGGHVYSGSEVLHEYLVIDHALLGVSMRWDNNKRFGHFSILH